MSIVVKEVTKNYGAQRALDQISFEIEAGTILGFLGPNGAGKSTMMKIITGFIPATSGDVWVEGLNIKDHSIEVRRMLGYLPEHNPLYLEMYVVEYLDFVSGLYGMNSRQRRAKTDLMIEKTGLTVERKKKIGALSKGYRQRVGLAQAMIHDPRVLILDEPTSGLDPNQIVEIRNLIVELGKEKTVMLSTHIMQEVEAICDKVMIIKQGRLVADNSLDEIAGATGQAQTVVVEFSAPADEQALRAIAGAQRVSPLKGNSWLIESTGETDIRPAIFNFAVAAGIAVLSMQQKEKRLEEVFQELTR